MWSSQVIWGCFSPSTNKYSISERKREASVWEKIKRWSSERDRDRIVVGPRLFLATWGGERQLVQTKDWMRVGRWTPVHWTGTRASSQAHLIPAPPTSFLLRPKLIGKKKRKEIQVRSFSKLWFPLYLFLSFLSFSMQCSSHFLYYLCETCNNLGVCTRKLIVLFYCSALGKRCRMKSRDVHACGKDNEAKVLNKFVPCCSWHLILPGLTLMGFVCH